MKNLKEVNYIVLSTPRSGTNLFFNLLKKNGIAYNAPNPPFNTGFEAFRIDIIKTIDFKGIDIEWFIREQFKKNSIIYQEKIMQCFKIFPRQINFFLGKYNASNNTHITPEDFFDYIPKDTKYIRIKRSDTIRQAISLYIASYTKKWSQTKQNLKKPSRKFFCIFFKRNTQTPPFDYQKIKSHIINLQDDEREIEAIFDTLLAEHITLEYEIFSNDLLNTVRKVSDFLGVTIDCINTDVDLMVQRDANSEKLYDEFVEKSSQ